MFTMFPTAWAAPCPGRAIHVAQAVVTSTAPGPIPIRTRQYYPTWLELVRIGVLVDAVGSVAEVFGQW